MVINMDIKRRMLNHYQRWNIKLNEEEEFEKLRNRLIYELDKVWSMAFNDRDYEVRDIFEEIEQNLFWLYGYQYSPQSRHSTFCDQYDPQFEHYIFYKINNSRTLKDLATALQFLFLSIPERAEKSELVNFLAKVIKDVFDLSPMVGIGIKIARRGNSVIIYPEGAKLLDEGAINDVLAWLEDYPTVAKHFEQALTIYMSGEKEKYRNLLDNLRFSLEQLLKEILKNKKSLENQKQALLQWLKEKEMHQQIIDLYNQLVFGCYAKYQNEAVKHNEDYSENEIEFMIYLTGTFMRLLLRLAQS
jgi:hypothetical protein